MSYYIKYILLGLALAIVFYLVIIILSLFGVITVNADEVVKLFLV